MGLATCGPCAVAQTTEPAALEAVTVTLGRGQLRSVQGLSASEFANAIAGTSPLATVARLPGVSFQSADALGNYEWSTRFALRAFSQSQIGFTLDDVPLGDMSYSNFNGLHISRAVSSENLGSAFLSQGTGALDTASSSNLGGTLQFYTSLPRAQQGAQALQTWGSNGNQRQFVRVDSGNTGWGQAYLSYTAQEANKWKGAGSQRQTQWNLKYQAAWGAHQLSAFYNTSERREMDYQDMSLEMLNRLGYHWDNFYPDWGAALRAADTLCGNGTTTYVAQCDDAYFAGAGLRDDELGGITLRSSLTPHSKFKTTLYRHTNRGSGLWYTPYTPSPDGTPVSIRTTEYGINRAGLMTSLDMEHSAHAVKLAYWREANTFVQARRFYPLTSQQPGSSHQYPEQPFLTQWQYRFGLQTDQWSVADTYSASDTLSVGAGFKALRVAINGVAEVGSANPSGSMVAENHFLPQFGVNWQLSPRDELFSTVARNMRAFQGTATGTTPWATTAQGFAAIQNSVRPETSDTVEAGWRSRGPRFEASVTVYHTLFRDRLLGVQLGSSILGNPTVLANVGSVRATGAEAALSLRLQPGWNWTTSLSHSVARYQDDVVSNGVVVATAGKRVVDAPDTLVKTKLSYDGNPVFASMEVDYMSKRYYTYLNDASVAARTLLNLSAGYQRKAWGLLSDVRMTLGITNLLDTRYVATLGSNGFSNSDPNGTAQTLLPGAPRQVFVSIGARL